MEVVRCRGPLLSCSSASPSCWRSPRLRLTARTPDTARLLSLHRSSSTRLAAVTRFNNVNVTWTNTNTCGSFSGAGAGATWDWGPGVGATPCSGTLPSGTMTETASADGTVLATCTDTQGASTYGSESVSSFPSVPSECTTTGAGVSINSFFAQAYNAAGNPISAGSGGNYDWIIAVVVIIILILLLLFFFMRRKRKTSPAATAASPPPATPAPVSANHPRLLNARPALGKALYEEGKQDNHRDSSSHHRGGRGVWRLRILFPLHREQRRQLVHPLPEDGLRR